MAQVQKQIIFAQDGVVTPVAAIDQQHKITAQAYLQSANDWVRKANGLSKSKAKKFKLAVENTYNAILTGKEDSLPVGALAGYDANGAPWDAESLAVSIYNDLMYENSKKAPTTALPATSVSTTSSSTTSTGGLHGFDLSKGWGTDGGWLGDNLSGQIRIANMADHFLSKILEIKTAGTSGRKVVGLACTPELAAAFELTLRDIKSKAVDAANNPSNIDLNELRRLIYSLLQIGKALDGSDNQAFGSVFQQYFYDLLNQTDLEKKKAERVGQGYTFDNIPQLTAAQNAILNRTGKKFLLGYKDNQYYAFDNNYNLLPEGMEVNEDDTDDNTYLNGYIIGSDGRIYLGNLRNLTENDWANRLWSDWKQRQQEHYSPLYTRSSFNLANSYTEDKLLNSIMNSKWFKDLGDMQDLRFTDVSGLFSGKDKIVAVNPNGLDLLIDQYTKKLKLTPDTKFFFLDKEGKLRSGSKEQVESFLNSTYSTAGYGEETQLVGKDLVDLSGIWNDTEGLSGDTRMRKFNWKEFLLSSLTGYKGGLLGDLIAQTVRGTSIGDDPTAFFKMALKSFVSPNSIVDDRGLNMTGLEFRNLFDENKLLETLGLMVLSGDVILSPKELEQFNTLIRNRYYKKNKNSLTSSLQEGGIIKAAEGSELKLNSFVDKREGDWHEENDYNKELKDSEKLIKEAKEAGYNSPELYKANKQTDLKAVDALRFTTMALDVASIVAAFVPGAGTGVAAGLGLTAMGTDLAADLLDPAISAGLVLGNTVMNAGFAALGMIPGAKMAKVVKNLVKYAPKIITAAAGLGIALDESTQNTFKKLAQGKEKLNRQDWRNLSHVLSLVAAGTRGGKLALNNRKAAKGIISKDNKVIKGATTEDGKAPLELLKKQIDSIDSELKKAKTKEEAIAVLKKYKLSLKQAEDALQIKTKRGLKGKTEEYSIDTLDATDEASIMKLWNDETRILQQLTKSGFGRAAIAFANKVGGGAYTGLLRGLVNSGRANLSDGYEYYNPFIDYLGKRTGVISLLPEQLATPKEILALPLRSWNPRVSQIELNALGGPKSGQNLASFKKLKQLGDVVKLTPELIQYLGLEGARNTWYSPSAGGIGHVIWGRKDGGVLDRLDEFIKNK